ncbi:hypothetical protein NRK98_03895 [Aeromonas dhakensis]|uniref:hypothetical protein n=1 Tax=Aeromonas dhakensis TaxID=196024 RepID=UPI00227AA7B7|nr:hypothetical protein [Aeromonas dhakensis]WAF69199.1 hypothetical protein NRK98_03895 [Aeromonas dhakensis]
MEKSKKKSRIKLLSWIAALCIAQFMTDRFFFNIPKPMMDKDIEFYQPKSDLEKNLRDMNIYIHDKNLISQLSIETGQKSVDDTYMFILREYHAQMLELYRMILSKPVAMSINKMIENIAISIKYTNSDQCIMVGNSNETFDNLINEYPSLIERLNQRPEAIIKIHQRIYNVMPMKDEHENYNTDGLIERIEIIRDLMQDPYLSVRKDNTEALQEINQFLALFDDLHTVYTRCAENYNNKIKNMEEYRDVASFILFILLTFFIYCKEILN